MVLDYIWLHPILDVNHAILHAPIYVIATHQAHQREGPKDHVLQGKTMLPVVTCMALAFQVPIETRIGQTKKSAYLELMGYE